MGKPTYPASLVLLVPLCWMSSQMMDISHVVD